MLPRSFLDPILADERLTEPLGDAEARILVEFLVEQAERLETLTTSPQLINARIGRLCRRGRVISRVVRLWCQDREPGAACQLAASEGLAEALPSGQVDACELMNRLIYLESVRNTV
ncbi:MAG: hypothetical protein EBV06_07810 [Planctomycetia bacterium]|jgi:hypothetical protein|nr:hypothetical protein [Planctomycetia bacterium]